MPDPKPGYEDWIGELMRLAIERELQWIVGHSADAHRTAYDSGLTPDEELSTLAGMAEWRGCGCGGG